MRRRDPVAGGRLPFAGYDRLDDRKVIDALSDHSQIELEAVEAYERSHKSREPVLDKLRYMRGPEPLPGYDALSVEEIVSALEGADPATIQKVRGYERKFANRPAVLEAVVRSHHRRLARPAGESGARLSADERTARASGIDRRRAAGHDPVPSLVGRA